MIYFCTYCDQGYAARMLCLHASLRAQGEPFRLFVLCFDATTAAVVAAEGDESLVALPLEEFMAADPAYAATRPTRSRVEFYFTATAVLVRHIFTRVPEAEIVTYLDADLFFFRPASAVLVEQGDASVGIVPHRFRTKPAAAAHYGTFNVGWVSFRRNAEGLAAVEWWRERCLEWCYDRVEGGRFADQGYLDDFPRRFHGVGILGHPGINAAPWNLDPDRLTRRDGKPCVEGQPLFFYHFQGVREVLPGWYDPGLQHHGARLNRAVRELLYEPYLRELAAAQRRVLRAGIVPRYGYARLPAGWGISAVWERLRAGPLGFLYRRLRGRLIHCPVPPS